MSIWSNLTDRSLAELRSAPETYRPTNFWGPGLDQLLDDMSGGGLESFKTWPTSRVWFYPVYGNGYSNATIAEVFATARSVNPHATQPFLAGGLNGSLDARRDHDVACATWDQARWPFDLDSHGESKIGKPPQAYRLNPRNQDVAFGRAYLNYLLCLSALSRHVEAPPRSFLEIGGGFGVLGEILLSRDPATRYVDIDIPPLLTVASYYLTELFGKDRIATYDASVLPQGPITSTGSAVLPNYRLGDLQDTFEVFVNSYSFQEMEPDVVDRYIGQVCDRGITWAVSLNSRDGKPRAAQSGEWGALDPVRSADIAEMFGRRGMRVVGTYDTPMVRSAGQLLILRRD